MATSEDITKVVNTVYSERARNGIDSNYSTTVASAAGYSTEQLASIPASANLGLSCGNPVEGAALQAGEAVLDLGSGGGLDVFLAADQVGSTGIVVGLDGSKDMVDLARRNAKTKGVTPPHVAFTQASLVEELPIESSSVDCILSNCVLNLLPDAGKASILREAYRVLKPGGRIHLSDIIAIQDIPSEIKNDVVFHVNCVSGAISKGKYENLLRKAGFADISLSNSGSDINPCCSGFSQSQKHNSRNVQLHPTDGSDARSSFDRNKFVGMSSYFERNIIARLILSEASHQISARKPRSPQEDISHTVLKQWWDAYPPVKSSPEAMTAEEVASLIRDPAKSMKDFTVVDVRRNDHAGGHVRGSHQCPAQSFYDDAATYFERFKDSEKVIFYCQSSNGRGPRCAGWYQDYLDSRGHNSSKAYVLSGGIKGWMAWFKGHDDLVDYD